MAVLSYVQVNIARYNEEMLKKTHDLKSDHPELLRSLPSDDGSSVINTYSSQKELPLSLSSGKKDLEIPMPPLWLVPLQQNSIRYYIALRFNEILNCAFVYSV